MATPPDPNKRKPKSAMPSRKKAIEDMCKMCSYDKLAEGTWREQVAACPCEKSCPLHPVRPMPTTRIKTVQVEGDES